MAKKKGSGGRVTAKGTQPNGAPPAPAKATGRFGPPRAVPDRPDGGHQRSFEGHAPVRAGHHRGNR